MAEDSTEETQFVVDEVSNIIKESIETTIGGNAYAHAKVSQWTNSVVESCLGEYWFRRRSNRGQKQCPIQLVYDLFLHLPPEPLSVKSFSNETAKTIQVYCDMCDYAKEWSRTSHSELVLLGQLDGWLLYSQMGEQNYVLHRLGFWTCYLVVMKQKNIENTKFG